jgi:hypothetical protein
MTHLTATTPNRSIAVADLALYAISAAALLLLARRAYSTFDMSWDAIAYHMPYAARQVGICGPDCFEMAWYFEVLYRALPPAADFLLGLFWRLAGFPEAANFVALGSLVAFIAYLRKAWSVPWNLSTPALLTIPIVQIHATSTYVDLPVNVAVAICALLLLQLALNPQKFGWRSLGLFVAMLVFAGNGKTQMFGVVALLGVAFVILLNCDESSPVHGAWRIRLREWRGIALTIALALLTAASALSNWAAFGNPFFPVKISLFGLELPGMMPVLAANSTPDYLANAPGPLRWLLSVLEFQALDFRYTPWTIDQAAVEQSARSFRMGGYFGAYVVMNVALLAYAALRIDARRRRIITVFMLLLTALTAVMPAAHELRYYSYWMLCLVAVNLALFSLPELKAGRPFYLMLVLSCGAYVLALTGGRWFEIGRTADNTVVETGIRAKIDAVVTDGATLCIHNAWPQAFLYARVFHPGRSYKAIEDGDPARCSATIGEAS